MEKEFVTYEVALALKELGFDERCFGYYQLTEIRDYKQGLKITYEMHLNTINGYRLYNNIGYRLYNNIREPAAPLKQQVFRWFRDKHEWYANLSSWLHEEEIGTYHEFEIYGANQYAHGSVPFKTYEEAENACIDKLIEISKEQQ